MTAVSRRVDPDKLRAVAQAKRHLLSMLSPRSPRHADRDAEAAFMQGGRPIEVLHAGERLEVRAWGDEGPAVLLVHGLFVSGGKFRSIIPALVACGMRPIAFDVPGHGESPGEFVEEDDVAEAILDLDAALGPFWALICHSMGFVWAMRAMHAGLRASRVVCIGAPLIVGNPIDAYVARAELDPAVEREFRRLAAAFGLGVPTPREVAAEMTGPCLVIHDRDDPLAPFKEGEELAHVWKSSRSFWTSRLGHFKTLSDPSVISEIVGFLSESRDVAVA